MAACHTAVAIFRRGAMLGLAVPGVLLEEELRREDGGGGCTVKKKSSGDCESVASMHYARGGRWHSTARVCLAVRPYGRTAYQKAKAFLPESNTVNLRKTNKCT